MQPFRTIACGCALLSACVLRGVIPEEPAGVPAVITMGQRSGFTGSYPGSIRSDREGRLWVSTDLGELYVGDGLRFLKVDLPAGIRGEGFGGMEFDTAGRLWLLTTGGLAYHDGRAWKVDRDLRLPEISGTRKAEGLFRSPLGELVGLVPGKAFRVGSGGALRWLDLPGTSQQGEPGVIWRGSTLVANRGTRVWEQKGAQWERLPALPLQGTERLRGALRCDGAGHLYALTERRLLHLSPGGTDWKPLSYRPSPDGDRITDLSDGAVWMLQSGQAQRMFQGRIASLPLPADLSMYGTEARCLDGEGNLWLTSTSLMRLPAYGLLRVHSGTNGLPAKAVWRILRDAKGRLWAATETGLFRQDPDGWRGTPEAPSGHGLAEGPDGALYMRSQWRLVRVDPDSLKATVLKVDPAVSAQGVGRGPLLRGRDLWFLDRSGALIRGTWSEDGWTWVREDSPPIDLQRIIYPVMDEIGRLWLLTADKTYLREAGRWEEVQALRGRNMIDLVASQSDQAWAVTYSPPALLALKRGATGWTVREEVRPGQLPGTGTLYTVQRDGQGVFWFNTDRGVVRYEAGTPPRFLHFGGELGLPAEDTNQGALLLDGGRVWVGTAQGLAEIRYMEGPRLPSLQAPLVLQARSGGEQLPLDAARLTIPYGKWPVVWELGFPGPVRGEGARFQFREAGGVWADLAGSALQFPLISPGHHAFEVRVAPFVGAPGPSRRLELRVLPPWYRHPAAYAGMLALLGAGGILLVRLRMQRLQRRNRELSLAVDRATEGLRRRETELEELNRRLYHLNETKNRVIGLAAHDLRNPLSGVLLHAELLKEDPPPEIQRQAVSNIVSLGGAMRDLIQRLLDVHAIEAGHAEAPLLRPLDLHRHLSRACVHASARAVQKGMSLLFADAPGPSVQADEAQLDQILDNYLSNALKYASAESTITARIRDAGPCWRVEVQDEGPGLTAQDLERVFGEYARLSARPTGGETSVGLGLSLVKRLAEGMGGRVGVESVLGEGSTFWVELPKA